jgi:hypothetical protein
MASPDSFIRSAARATYSAYRSVPIRWRLAGGSAALTLVILASFAGIVGVLTNRQVRTQFDDQESSAVSGLVSEFNGKLQMRGTRLHCNRNKLYDYASFERAEIRFFDSSDGYLLCTAPPAPKIFQTPPVENSGTFTQDGYRVVVRLLDVKPVGTVKLLYALPLSDVDQTLARVRVFLLLGVVGGAILALLAGLSTFATTNRLSRKAKVTNRR